MMALSFGASDSSFTRFFILSGSSYLEQCRGEKIRHIQRKSGDASMRYGISGNWKESKPPGKKQKATNKTAK